MKTKPSLPERKTIPVSCNKDCAAGCPLLAHVEDGKIIKITDNPNGTPYMKGCSKGFQAMKAAYAPDRLLIPLIRTGLRGSGDYKEVSWDEALDYVAAGLRKIKGTFGSESILFLGGSGSCRGALHNTSSLTQRFLNMFGGCREYGRVSMGKEGTKRAQQTFLHRQIQQNHVWDPAHIRCWWRWNCR
jgi:anaerobic dimethyl sulfoxide reductase subunit A